MKVAVVALVAACSGGSPDLSKPISCDRDGADVIGDLGGIDGPVRFGPVEAQLFSRVAETPQTLRLTDGEMSLSFYLEYDDIPPPVGEYDKHAALVVAGDSYNGNGTLTVDASDWPEDTSQRCFAGRFEQTFLDGTLAGWFRVP